MVKTNEEGKNNLAKEDVFLLMEFYQNLIEPLTIIAQKQDKIIEEQSKSVNSLGNIADKLNNCSNSCSRAQESHQVDRTHATAREHKSILNNINLLYVMLTVIIAQLLAVVIKTVF